MRQLLMIALGGALGSVLRYSFYVWLPTTSAPSFPWATLCVNLIGCLVAGLTMGLIIHHQVLSAEWRLFLMVGLTGGFTTFSAFGLETFELLRRDAVAVAATYVSASVMVGLLCVWLGYTLVTKS